MISPPDCAPPPQSVTTGLQRMATGRVSPESFTHGSSAQRMAWFKKGLDSGRVSACNTLER
jgi:predicted metalloprotease